MNAIRLLISACLWYFAALCAVAGSKVAPRPKVTRYVVEGVKAVPVADLPREQILVPVDAWLPGLTFYATFHDGEGRA